MALLLMIRHGDFNQDNSRLNEPGCQKLKLTAREELRSLINGGNALIITSPTLRAAESAQVLSQELDGIPIEESDLLCGESCDGEKIMWFLKQKSALVDVLLAVTHLPNCIDTSFCLMLDETYAQLKIKINEKMPMGEICIRVEDFF